MHKTLYFYSKMQNMLSGYRPSCSFRSTRRACRGQKTTKITSIRPHVKTTCKSKATQSKGRKVTEHDTADCTYDVRTICSVDESSTPFNISIFIKPPCSQQSLLSAADNICLVHVHWRRLCIMLVCLRICLPELY